MERDICDDEIKSYRRERIKDPHYVAWLSEQGAERVDWLQEHHEDYRQTEKFEMERSEREIISLRD